MFYLGIKSQGKVYERRVYTMQDMLGKLGGIKNAFQIIFGVIVLVINWNMTYNKMIQIFKEALVPELYKD